jgi:hypothetical protein
LISISNAAIAENFLQQLRQESIAAENAGTQRITGEKLMPYIDEGHVYFLKMTDQDYYKIGVSQGNVVERLNAIRIGNPFEILPVGAYLVKDPYSIEKYLHKKLADFKMRAEWFNLPLHQAIAVSSKLFENSTKCNCSSFCRFEYVPRLAGRWDSKLTEWFKDLRSNYTMIKVEVDIYDEDLAKFNAIKNKAEWLHEHLNQTDLPEVERIKRSINQPINYGRYDPEPTLTPPEEAA